jgi:hypothetical protein
MKEVELRSAIMVTKISIDSFRTVQTYWLTRIVFLRCLGIVYATAFLVAYDQNISLLGEKGLTPAKEYLDSIDSTLGSIYSSQKVLQIPTLFFMFGQGASTDNLTHVAAAGLVLALFVTAFGRANMILLFILWLLYSSIVNVGQIWYSFGWEMQLLETGFLAIFLCPVVSLNGFSKWTPTPYK